ncbi:MAG: tetratricopeptide repeat protein [Limnohabitans sp.]
MQTILLSLMVLGSSAQADAYDDTERLIRNGQLERASQLASRHLQASPQDPQMRLLLSRILDRQGKTDDAIAQLESLCQEFPELPEPHNNLAVLYARLGRMQDAMDSLNKALLARPDYTTALENLGDLHLSLALQAYRRAGGSPGAPASLQHKADTLAPLLKR